MMLSRFICNYVPSCFLRRPQCSFENDLVYASIVCSCQLLRSGTLSAAINGCLSPFILEMILFAGTSKFQSTTCTLSWMWDVWFLLSVQRIWSHTKHDICSLQIYHNSSSNEIWRGQWRLFFDCTINISNYKKPELAIDHYVPWKLTPKSAMTMS